MISEMISKGTLENALRELHETFDKSQPPLEFVYHIVDTSKIDKEGLNPYYGPYATWQEAVNDLYEFPEKAQTFYMKINIKHIKGFLPVAVYIDRNKNLATVYGEGELAKPIEASKLIYNTLEEILSKYKIEVKEEI